MTSIGQSEARRQIERYRPEIQAGVSAIIDGLLANKKQVTEKSIADAFSYVRCPYCWSRVYRSNSLLMADTDKSKDCDEEEDTDKPEEGEKPDKDCDSKKKSDFWSTLLAATTK